MNTLKITCLNRTACKNKFVRVKAALTLSAFCLTLAPVYAAENPSGISSPPAQLALPIEEMVVTGSRVIRDGYSAPTPMTVVTAEQIQTVAPGNIADFLNTLPALFGTASTRQGNNSISSATTGMNRLNLRGIGTERTLVLVDGRRFVASTLAGNVDVNNIPGALVERVEVVTGGASAVYGSDAVAGVVNFVLNTKFTGLKGEAQYGQSTYDDDEQGKFNLTYGTPFSGGRGQFLLSGEYARNEGVDNARDRSWFQSWGVVNNPEFTAINGQPRRLVRRGVIDTRAASGGLITAGPLGGTTFNQDGTPRAFDYGEFRSGVLAVGGEGDSRFAVVSVDGKLARNYIFARGSYELTDRSEVFAEASYSNSVSKTQSSYNNFLGNLTIQSDNAYLHPSVQAAMEDADVTAVPYGIFMGIASPRVDISNYRAVMGLDATVGNGWAWNSYYQYGQSNLVDEVRNTTNPGNLRLALDAVAGSDGVATCRSTLADPDNGCVPINTFGFASITDEALAFVNGTPYFEQDFKQHVASTTISGEPFSTWAGPVSVAAGAEYRRESVSGKSDLIGQARGWVFANFLPTEGSINAREVFVEALVPLAEDRRFIRSLNFNGAARITDYSESGIEGTWKAGLTYEPLNGLRLRATRSRDIRAPNLGDLFQAGLTQRQNAVDRFQNDVSVQINRISSGNLDLNPETSDTTSFGVVFEPVAFPQLRATIDYFDIDISDAITTLTNQQTVDRCFSGDESVCQFIIRDETGTITDLLIRPINIASLRTSGVDFDVNFHMALPFLAPDADLSFRLLATHVSKFIQDNSFVQQEFVGRNSRLGVPDWRGSLAAIYSQGPFQISMTSRFLSSGVLNNDFEQGIDIDDNGVPSITYFDLGGAYEFADGRTQVYFRADNLFNKKPPVIATDLQGVNPTLYDTIGRLIRAGVRYQF